MNKAHSPILFVGAGPGDPDLITLKGRDALAAADRVIYAGSLVPKALLAHCRPGVLALDSSAMDLAAIVDAMADGYRRNESVVRLHTGDPSLYGAIHEQMALLNERSIPYAVIPGVTAAFAAAAAAGLEYTLPEKTQTLILTRIAGRTPVPDEESLESLAAHGASMALYLSAGQTGLVSEILSRAYGADSPCILAVKISHPDEAIYRLPIGDLPGFAEEKQITRHALILVGPAVCHAGTPAETRSMLYDAHFSHLYRNGLPEETA